MLDNAYDLRNINDYVNVDAWFVRADADTYLWLAPGCRINDSLSRDPRDAVRALAEEKSKRVGVHDA